MGTEDRTGLIETLRRFLGDARQVVDSEKNRGDSTAQSVQALAQSLAALPTCIEVNALAQQASLAVGYLLPQPAGRPLNADALVSTGLIGMLLDHAEVDLLAVASDLAGYLAGPPTDIWDYAILDGAGSLQRSVQVADGWELITPSADELRMVLPLPNISDYQPDRPFDPRDYSHLAMLRRVDHSAAPHRGMVLHWDVLYFLATGRTQHLLWQPLSALSLYANPVLHLWARYRIEPRRRTDKLFDSVEWEVLTLDGETEIERPRAGAFVLDASTEPRLRRFLEELSPHLTTALDTQASSRKTKKNKEEAANRLRLITCWGYRLATTARLIALGHLESGRPGCGPRGFITAKKVEGQRDRRHGGREERGTPIHRS